MGARTSEPRVCWVQKNAWPLPQGNFESVTIESISTSSRLLAFSGGPYHAIQLERNGTAGFSSTDPNGSGNSGGSDKFMGVNSKVKDRLGWTRGTEHLRHLLALRFPLALCIAHRGFAHAYKALLWLAILLVLFTTFWVCLSLPPMAEKWSLLRFPQTIRRTK